MNDQHDALQVIGSIVLTVYAVLLLAVRFVRGLHAGWKDAILLAALYNLVVVVVRVAAYLGVLEQLEARVLNGLIVIVFLCTLVVSLIGHWYIAKRCSIPSGRC